MAWCPICKCEYKGGITKCAECKVDLVDSLETEQAEPLFLQEEGEADCECFGADDILENENIHFIDREAQAAAVKIAKKQSTVYRNSEELSNENKSSAYILLPVGVLGIVTLVLIWLDVIPLYSSITSKVITSTVMGTLFLVFIVMGVLSLKNAKKFKEKASEEGNLSSEILNYFSKNVSAEILDEKIMDSEWDTLSEEEKYFKRIDGIRACITKQFMNLEDNYVDYMCDEIYTKLYEE